MSNFLVPRKPSTPLKVSNSITNKPSNVDPQELIRQIQAAVAEKKLTPEQVAALITDLQKEIPAADNSSAVPAQQGLPGIYNTPRDSISVGGSAMPGSNLGEGTVNNGDIAGNNLTKNSVSAQVYYQIGTLNAAPGAATLPGTGDMVIEGQTRLSEEERAYLSRVLATASRVPLGQLDLEISGTDNVIHEIRLDSVYVPLDTTILQPALGGKPDERVPVPVLTQTIQNNRLVILGDPGSGKSTFLNYLTFCLAGARLDPVRYPLTRLNVEQQNGQRATRWKHPALLPVRVDLREFAQDIPAAGVARGSFNLMWTHMVKLLDQHGMEAFAPRLRELLQKGDCIVLFDGMDEVIDKKHRQIVREAITDFADTFTENHYIVTCRVLSYNDPAWKLTSFPDVTLAPLSKASVSIFIENWYNTLSSLGYMDARWNRAKSDELRGAATSHLYDLAQNPMLLTVTAVVHTYKGTLPRERARLYQDCVGLLLWNWQRTKQVGPGHWEQGILDELGTREERVMNGLCDVAFQAHRAQGKWPDAAYIPESELLGILKTYLDDDWGKAQKFCEYVEKRAGLLVGRGSESANGTLYSFPHRGFQEFLSGQHLVNSRDFARRAAELAREGDLWHEVLLLAAGHLVFNVNDVNRPLDAANLMVPESAPVDDSAWRAIWWAAEILLVVGKSAAEQDEYVGKKLVPRVIHHLSALLQSDRLIPHERAGAGDSLGHLGDPRNGVCSRQPDMIELEGGVFHIGPEQEMHAVRLKPFSLARYPVTNAQFREFMEKGYQKNEFWTPQGLEWRKQTHQYGGLLNDPTWGVDNRPAAGIAWHEAVAYANWLRKVTGKPFRLPTEAEWERAATGSERRKYPWGNRTTDDTANTREAGIGQTTAVGIFANDKTPEGIYDLGGNVWEWTNTLATTYPYRADDGREKLDVTGQRILRGGAFETKRENLHCTQRRPVDPATRPRMFGFRVAMDGE